MKQSRLGESLAAIIFIITSGRSLQAQTVPGRYVWPIEGKTNISAGFCDYRARHYHGGIDLSTDRQEGFPVRAADSGWVMRVSTSYWGYGKAVYLLLATGNMAVYGHLSEFSDEIQDYVEAEQYKTKRYGQNLFPTERQIPISRGEVIGRSGQTGAGPPHLHFEIRTNGNRPLNTLAFFEKPDRIAPSIHSVTIAPIQPDDLDTPPSTVDGSLLPKTFAVRAGKLPSTPHVTGTIGISVLADDHIDARQWTMSAYRHRLIVNGLELGLVQYDSINYDDTRLIDLERVYDPDAGIAPRAVNLYRHSRNTLWHYHGFAEDGGLAVDDGLKPGANEIRIEVEDLAGNQESVTISIEAMNESVIGNLASPPERGLAMVPAWGGVVLVVAESSEKPAASLDGAGKIRLNQWIKGKGGWQAWLPASVRADSIWVSLREWRNRIVPPYKLPSRCFSVDDGGLLGSADGKASVTIGAGDLYESSCLKISSREAGQQSAVLTPIYTISPTDFPLAADVHLSIDMPRTTVPTEKLGIYRNRGTNWAYEGNEVEKGRPALEAMIKNPGSFAVLADQTKPVISGVTPAAKSAVSQNRPTIRFTVSDNLSGIGSDEDLTLTIDGKWVPVEYDPDLNAAKARPRWDLDPGEHRVEITARDRSGNQAQLLRTFRVSQ